MRRVQTNSHTRTVVISAFFADVLCKALALSGFAYIPLFKNYASAFGLTFPPLVHTVLAPGVLLILLGYTAKRRSTALLAITLGALSNVVDRAVHGFTTDYLIFFNYTAWNIADILIVTGLFFLVWYGDEAKEKR